MSSDEGSVRRTLVAGAADERAVSTAVSYVLTLGLTTILISGLLIAAGGTVDERQQVTTQASLEVAGQRLAANLMTADRLAETSGTTAVSVTVDLPAQVSGSTYGVAVDPGASRLVLESGSTGVSVVVGFTATTPVDATSVRGGDLRIVLDSGALEVRSA
ncbi:DUF7266 family protein [Haloplanus halobius]|uniref:DUF7266 family protein n=1 Tax=Haloplanus halobius TaxID=2934938 RepID=UPI0020107E6B|nr:hypothetical protein [Haloplanus sp. XH21]